MSAAPKHERKNYEKNPPQLVFNSFPGHGPEGPLLLDQIRENVMIHGPATMQAYYYITSAKAHRRELEPIFKQYKFKKGIRYYFFDDRDHSAHWLSFSDEMVDIYTDHPRTQLKMDMGKEDNFSRKWDPKKDVAVTERTEHGISKHHAEGGQHLKFRHMQQFAGRTMQVVANEALDRHHYPVAGLAEFNWLLENQHKPYAVPEYMKSGAIFVFLGTIDKNMPTTVMTLRWTGNQFKVEPTSTNTTWWVAHRAVLKVH